MLNKFLSALFHNDIPKVQLRSWVILAEACPATFSKWTVAVEKQQQQHNAVALLQKFKTVVKLF